MVKSITLSEAYTVFRDLEDRVNNASKEYYHSRPLAAYTVQTAQRVRPVSIGLRALLLLCATTGNNVLLSGGTGCGKTHLAKMVQSGLVGDAYKVLQMDASFSLDKLRDIAFQTVKDGGRLSEAVQESPLVTAPMVIIDEYNRAPDELRNMIQGWLQNGSLVFEGGREVYPGVAYKNGNGESRYQWKIATLNEGALYGGARKVDKASRDRLAVEIPLDVFPPTDEDRRNMREKRSSGIGVHAGDVGALESLWQAMSAVSSLPLGGDADEFLLYLGRMGQCIKAPNKTKLEIERFSPEYCKGCHHSARNSNLCGSVFAPSDRSLINLQSLAQGFALYRGLQAEDDPEKLQVELEDIMAAAPFLLYGKIDIHPGWVDAVAKGSKWQAVNAVLKLVYTSFKQYFQKNWEHLQQGTPESQKALQKYAADTDPWCMELSRG